ncbi:MULTISPECIES: aspartate/glutamate racemase family protein [unclassified Pseudonocardia]|uniref:aspartate/glutamate racemase family protein n=1 Tax=unclassified Pseudonocardia TaxID=2619320 RepID=UPI001CF6D651|nr:amino acid racemase [Pseudonocardia sp. ICBG601]
MIAPERAPRATGPGTAPAPVAARGPAGPGAPDVPVIGILGGMGPAATADFYTKLVDATPASRDQEHRRVVIWSDPTVPDRTESLQGRGPDPLPWLRAGAEKLQEAGATHIAIPCNTAHAFVPALLQYVDVPVVHMIDEVARSLAGAAPPVRCAGLLATDGTVGTGLYQDWLHRRGVEVIVPDARDQRAVMTAILSIKAGRRGAAETAALAAVADRLARAGAEAVVAGCTEIPLCLATTDVTVPLLDPARILARAMVALTAPI